MSNGFICSNCGSVMRHDDRDFNFKGNYDDYYLCDNCHWGCILQYRFGQLFKEIWSSEEREFIVKHNIKR